MKQTKILIPKEVIRVEPTKGLTGSLYLAFYSVLAQFQRTTRYKIYNLAKLTHANFLYDMAEPIQFPEEIVQNEDRIEQPMQQQDVQQLPPQQQDVQQPPPQQQQREPPVAAPGDLEVSGSF